MAVFAYKAADGGAAVVRGTIAADSPRQARDQLRARGLVVQEISPQAQAAGRLASWSPLRRRGRHAARLIIESDAERWRLPMVARLGAVAENENADLR